MATKQPRNAKEQLPQEADDFKPIKGINTMIENRLHAAGIQTYEQLAALTPAEIAKRVGKLTGINVERIKEQNWVGQARELAKQHRPSTAEVEFDNVGFVVDLFLNPRKQVQSTQILNVKSGVGDTWKGWDEKRLLNFFVEQSQMKLPAAKLPVSTAFAETAPATLVEVEPSPIVLTTETAPATLVEVEVESSPVAVAEEVPVVTVVPEPAPTVVEAAVSGIEVLPMSTSSAEPILRELQVVTGETLQPTNWLKSGEPFHVQLELNLAEQMKRKTAPLNYTASIYAKRRGAQSREVLCVTHGEIKMSDEKLDMGELKRDLQPGVYDLTASLVVMEGEKGSQLQPVQASLANRLFHVN